MIGELLSDDLRTRQTIHCRLLAKSSKVNQFVVGQIASALMVDTIVSRWSLNRISGRQKFRVCYFSGWIELFLNAFSEGAIIREGCLAEMLRSATSAGAHARWEGAI